MYQRASPWCLVALALCLALHPQAAGYGVRVKVVGPTSTTPIKLHDFRSSINGRKDTCPGRHQWKNHTSRRLYSLQIVESHDEDTYPDTSDTEEPAALLHTLIALPSKDESPHISLSALTGIRSKKYRTIKLPVHSGGLRLVALIDTGSSLNFIDAEVARQLRLQPLDGTALSVMVGNGGRIKTADCIPDVEIVTTKNLLIYYD